MAAVGFLVVAAFLAVLLGGGRAWAQPSGHSGGTAGPAAGATPPERTFTYQRKALPSGGVVPAALTQPTDRGGGAPEVGEETTFRIQVEPPGPQRLFRLESEAQLFERMRQEGRERTPPERITFPVEPVVSDRRYDPYARALHWPPANAIVEPYYVCHGRLLFEQRNAERYGWDLGPFHPFISAGGFVVNTVALPYNLARYPCRRYECSAGLCLPGDPVPLMLYPPEVTLTGLVAEAAVAAALFAIFP